MNGSVGPLQPLFKIMPASRFFFVLYMVLCSWSILSILTAVVTDNMSQVSESNQEEKEKEEAEQEWKESMDKIKDILNKVDMDNNEKICQDEFEKLLQDGKTSEQLRTAA